MKFNDLESKLRRFETSHDHCVLPGLYMVARIDGRGFTRLTKEIHKFEAPYDERFRDHMLAAVQHLMNCGFRVLYGYTQSDEISLLFHRNETLFDRKLRKYNSVLAAEASAAFSLKLGAIGTFDSPIKCPAFSKKKENRAGSTLFVSPELVVGTLKQGFEVYRLIDTLCIARSF